MRSTVMRKEISKGGCDDGVPLDRLSALPDSIISHILSFLPTKQAVKTTVLSKNLKYHWTSITNLDFNDGLENIHSLTPKTVEMQKNKFVCFLYYVLAMLNSPRIHKFSLKCRDLNDKSYVNTSMHAASRRDVEQLDVSIESNLFEDENLVMKFPGDISYWGRLEMLKLNGSSIIVCGVSTSTVAFPKLKTLHLVEVEYEDDDSLPKFLSSCPLLSDLVLNRSCLFGVISTTILSSSLVNLTLELYGDSDICDSHLKIIAPALRYLDLSDELTCGFSFENLSSLETAYINVNSQNTESIVRMLKAISNVSELRVSKWTMQGLYDVSGLGFEFSNLEKLDVTFFKGKRRRLYGLLDSVDFDKLYELKTSSE